MLSRLAGRVSAAGSPGLDTDPWGTAAGRGGAAADRPGSASESPGAAGADLPRMTLTACRGSFDCHIHCIHILWIGSDR